MQEDRRFLTDTTRYGYQTIALIAESWTDWLPLRRAGLTPRRAFDLVFDGDRSSWPGRLLVNRDGDTLMSS